MNMQEWRVCVNCRKPFAATHGSQKFCDTPCYAESLALKKTENKEDFRSCGTCKWGKYNASADSRFECTRSWALICKPWITYAKWEPK